jgi:predicted amidohydrolase
MLISAEWPSRRAEHWRALLRARAIENQAFVIACNRVGQSNGELFVGLSAVVDPWGDAVIEGDSCAESVYTVDIETDKVDEIRSSISVLANRRPELY